MQQLGGAIVCWPADAGMDWGAITADASVPLVFTNSMAQARRLCIEGHAAVAVLGLSKAKLSRWLRKHGANVIEKGSAH